MHILIALRLDGIYTKNGEFAFSWKKMASKKHLKGGQTQSILRYVKRGPNKDTVRWPNHLLMPLLPIIIKYCV